MTDTLHMQITLDKLPQVVYDALTDSGKLAAWFAEYTDVGLPFMRYDFWGKHTPENPDREAGRHPVTSSLTDERLQYRWRLGDEDTTVTFSLRPQGNGTLLVMQQEGRYYEDFWFLSLTNLSRHLDGKPVTRVDYTHPMKGDIQHTIEIDADATTVFDIQRPRLNCLGVPVVVGRDADGQLFIRHKLDDLERHRRRTVVIPVKSRLDAGIRRNPAVQLLRANQRVEHCRRIRLDLDHMTKRSPHRPRRRIIDPRDGLTVEVTA